MTLAWYAAYGSNTDETRFRRYLARCTGDAEPRADRPHRIDRPLYFAGSMSRTWGDGGVAFVAPERDDQPSTLVRLWLLPTAVIAEIGALENGLPLEHAALDVEAADHAAFAGRWYDSWFACGELDGFPIVTLGAATRHEPRSSPGPAYTRVVAAGLRATHGLTRDAVARYLEPRTNLPFTTLMEWQAEGPG